MHLHLDHEAFSELVIATSEEMGIDSLIVEKDYYVSFVLYKLAQRVDDLVFRGGTSLSKCYQIIQRFSEDIDLTMHTKAGRPGAADRKRLKAATVEALQQMGAVLINRSALRSGMNYNLYEAEYASLSGGAGRLLVETNLGLPPYPCELLPVNNYIRDYLSKEKRFDLIEEYNLTPFDMKVQCLNRTFADKVFALCDYYLLNVDKGRSRHIYDLHMLDQYVPLDVSLYNLISRIREDRHLSSCCRPSAEANININEVLSKIVITDFYKQDYNKTTRALLFEPLPYETAIKQIKKIIESKCFE